MYVVDGAYEAGKRRDFETHDRLIREEVARLDGLYDQIVLAQISMAHAGEDLRTGRARIFTSPESAYRSLMQVMGQKEDQG